MHHIHPLNYGGADDGEKVPICAVCHDILHKEAEHYSRTGKFQEIDITIPYQKDMYGERIRQLIAYVVKAKAAFNEGLINAGEQRRMTQLSWDSDAELQLAHTVKEMMKFKSLERAIKHLVFEEYRRRTTK